MNRLESNIGVFRVEIFKELWSMRYWNEITGYRFSGDNWRIF